MGNFIFLQILAAVCALSIITTLFNKRILDFPQAIGVPIVSAVLVFILQWSASLLNGNQFITINILELTHYLKTKKRDSPTRVLDSNETNHQRLASILERLQR